MKQTGLAIIGAIVGGAVGYFLFFWLVRQGFYALALPGAGIGLGASFGNSRATWLTSLCGVGGLLLGIVCEYQIAPFVADSSFGFFLRNLHQLQPITWIMILLGAALAFYLPFRHRTA